MGSDLRGDAVGVIEPFFASIASMLMLPDIERGMIERKFGENFWLSFNIACSRLVVFITGFSGTGYMRHNKGGSLIA